MHSVEKFGTTRHRIRINRVILNYMFLLPAFIFIVFFLVYPMINTVILSMQDITLINLKQPHHFVGFDNYIKLFSNPNFKGALINSTIFTVVCVFFQFIIGFAFALIFNLKIAFRNILRAFILLCWLLPMIITGALFKWIFAGDFGILNHVLQLIGITDKNIFWLANTSTALWVVIIANIWLGVPFAMIILLGGLQSLPNELYEAASIDGAGRIKRFFYITLPLMRPTILILLTLFIIYTFKVFELIYVMTGGGPGYATMVIPLLAYRIGFQEYQINQGMALSTFMLILMMCIVALYNWFSRKESVL